MLSPVPTQGKLLSQLVVSVLPRVWVLIELGASVLVQPLVVLELCHSSLVVVVRVVLSRSYLRAHAPLSISSHPILLSRSPRFPAEPEHSYVLLLVFLLSYNPDIVRTACSPATVTFRRVAEYP